MAPTKWHGIVGHPGAFTIDTRFAIAAALSLGMLMLTTAWHHHALHSLAAISNGRRLSRLGVATFLVALVGVHVLEISLYAAAYSLGSHVLGLGHLRGSAAGGDLDFFYFAAETYSTLGYGDIVPLGALRLVASVQSLNGLMLLSWSGAFLYGVLDGHGHRS